MGRVHRCKKFLATCLSAILGVSSVSAHSSELGSKKIYLRNFVSTVKKHKKKMGIVLVSALSLFFSSRCSGRCALTGDQWFEILGGKQKDIENYKNYLKDPYVSNILMEKEGYQELADWKKLDLKTVDLDVSRTDQLFKETGKKQLLERILKTHCLKTNTYYTQGFNFFCGMVIRKFLESNPKSVDIDTEAKIYYVYSKILEVLTSQEWFLGNTFATKKMQENTKSLLVKYNMYQNLSSWVQNMDDYCAVFGSGILGILNSYFSFDELASIWSSIIQAHSKNGKFDAKAAYEDLFCSFNLKFLKQSKRYLDKEGKKDFDDFEEICEFVKNLKNC